MVGVSNTLGKHAIVDFDTARTVPFCSQLVITMRIKAPFIALSYLQACVPKCIETLHTIQMT